MEVAKKQEERKKEAKEALDKITSGIPVSRRRAGPGEVVHRLWVCLILVLVVQEEEEKEEDQTMRAVTVVWVSVLLQYLMPLSIPPLARHVHGDPGCFVFNGVVPGRHFLGGCSLRSLPFFFVPLVYSSHLWCLLCLWST